MMRLQALTSELAVRLGTAEPHRLSAEIEGGMAKLLALLKAGRVTWYVKRHDAAALVRMYEVNAPGMSFSGSCSGRSGNGSGLQADGSRSILVRVEARQLSRLYPRRQVFE
jgi:hypothetical protein